MGAVEAIAKTAGRETPDIADLVDKRFARFGVHPLSDEEIGALATACMVMPDGSPGAEGYLAKVAGVKSFDARLTLWGRVVAVGIASARYKAPDGQRFRDYVEGYDEAWGQHAVADGLALAIEGRAPGISDRCKQLRIGKQGYQRIRDFVGGAMVSAISEYRTALEWALGYRRDRVFEGRWEGITGANWDKARPHVTLGHTESVYPLLAPGCERTVPLKDQADSFAEQPETLYHGLRPTDWWDEAYAARMRSECPVVTTYPATDSIRLAADERAGHAADAASGLAGNPSEPLS